MKATIAAVLMALCIPAVCDAEDLPQVITTGDGFTISLPADWVAIPKDALDGLTETAVKLAPKAERQVYDYGFQLPKKKRWFEYPYILVQIKRTGRIPEGQLKSLRQINEGIHQDVEKTQTQYSTVISNAQVGETAYEPATHILWIRLSENVRTVGTVKEDVAGVLTEEGVIAVSGYAQPEDFEKYAPLFEAVARKIVVAENLKYRPRFTDSLPLSARINWGIVLRGMLIGAMAGCLPAVVAVIFIVRGKKKTDGGPEKGSGSSP